MCKEEVERNEEIERVSLEDLSIEDCIKYGKNCA